MRRYVIITLFIFALSAFSVFASDTNISLQLVEDPISKIVIVNGNINLGPECEIPLKITDDQGKIVYFDATSSTNGGDFSFAINTRYYAVGNYVISVKYNGIEQKHNFNVPFEGIGMPILCNVTNGTIFTLDDGSISSDFNTAYINVENTEVSESLIDPSNYEINNLPSNITVEMFGVSKKQLKLTFKGGGNGALLSNNEISIKLKSPIIRGGVANTSSDFIGGITIYSRNFSKRINFVSTAGLNFLMNNKTQVNQSANSVELELFSRKLNFDGILVRGIHYNHKNLPNGLSLTVVANKEASTIKIILAGTSISNILQEFIIDDFVLKSVCVVGAIEDSQNVRITIKENIDVPSVVTPNKSDNSNAPSKSNGNSITSANNTIDIIPVLPITSVSFKDIDKHWAETYINKLSGLGIVNGDSDGLFYPERSVSRSEFVSMIIRTMKFSLSKYDSAFGDVTSNDWYAKYVQTAIDNEIISSADTFRPNDLITREEMVKTAVSAYLKNHKTPEVIVSITTIKDKDSIESWAMDYVQTGLSLGIVKGYKDAMFLPKNNSTRAEASTIISRLIDVL